MKLPVCSFLHPLSLPASMSKYSAQHHTLEHSLCPFIIEGDQVLHPRKPESKILVVYILICLGSKRFNFNMSGVGTTRTMIQY
jgi:hypothetical protein